jgi:DNA-binding transcriptional MerR regulator
LDKAPEAFRTISEVADELDVPQHVLRFWESRFSQIKPMKRGGGRRYYRPEDVDLLRGIRHLLYGEGYTIRGVQRILREDGPKFVQSVWKAGAPQPARAGGEEEAGDDLVAAPDATAADDGDEQALPAFPLAKAKPPVAAPTPQPRLRGDDRRRLEAVLADLADCRRLLDVAMGPV